MPTISQIIRIRENHSKKEHRARLAWLTLAGAGLASMVLVAVLAGGVWFYYTVTQGLPTISILPSIFEQPNGAFFQPTRFYDRSGKYVLLTLENPAAEGKQYLAVGGSSAPGEKPLSTHLVDATLAALDPGFWKEPVFSLVGISDHTQITLAQRLVSALLLSPEHASLTRSLQLRWLAGQAMARFGREKILEWYLNSARYGEFVYGADAAARVYLGKPATQLSIAEAAMLTAILQSPGINPWQTSQLLRDRQVQVIQQMQEHGMISAAEAHEALRENIQIQPQQTIQSMAPAFFNLALLQLGAQLPLDRVYLGGFQIITTLDNDLQRQINCLTQVQMDRHQGSIEQPSAGGVTDCASASGLPPVQAGIGQSGSSIEAEVIILEPQTGEILAWAGGEISDPSPALPVRHPAGTILSPFLYMTAFAGGMSPASLVWDLPAGTSQNIPEDMLASYHGPVNIRTAMVNDYAGAASSVILQVGIDHVWQTQSKFGIRSLSAGTSAGSELQAFYSQPVSLLDSVQAYAVLANQGVKAGQIINGFGGGEQPGGISPSSLLKIQDAEGKTWLDWSDAQLQAVANDQLSYLATDVLSGSQILTPGQEKLNLMDIGRPRAVKFSLADENTDEWVVGYIPQLAVGVWLGSASNQMNAEMAPGLWQAVMKYAANPMPVVNFPEPEGIVHVRVCVPSGMLVSAACPAAAEEVFIRGNQPVEVDNLYQELQVDRQSGLLATIFTPTERVEMKTFLVVPSQAIEWAAAVKIPLPPQEYEEISARAQASSDARLTNPPMFADVSGDVTFIGSAMGDDFSYYRIQVGKGLNPQEWIQVGADVRQPVAEGSLATWDTGGLEGMYVVELLVVRQDLRVERALLQVTVDNDPPQVKILAPQDQGSLHVSPGGYIVFQVDATDNLAVKKLEFYVDDELVSTLYEPPYVVPWLAIDGSHVLRVTVFDLSGNSSEAVRSFSTYK